MFRKYTRLPVHVVEDHNDVLYYILRAIGSKHLSMKENLLIHFDSHPDMLIPSDIKASDIYDINILIEKISIENWIMPAVFAGHVSTIAWLKPPWSNQIDDGHYKFVIGKHKTTGELGVSSSLLYFLSEMLYCPEEDMDSLQEVQLHVMTIDKMWNNLSCEDRLSMLIEEHDNRYILDVDLDFFSTLNPFINMFSNIDMYDYLKEIYEFSFDATTVTSLHKLQVERADQVNILRQIFCKLAELNEPLLIKANVEKLCEYIKNTSKRKSLQNLISRLCEYSDVDWLLVHDAGCTCDDANRPLPHHPSSNDEIVSLVKQFECLMDCLPDPILTTIARSSLDDYCPPDKVDFIQEQVCSYLRVRCDADVKAHFKDDIQANHT